MITQVKYDYQDYKHCPVCGSSYNNSSLSVDGSTCYTCSNCTYRLYIAGKPCISLILPLKSDPSKILLTKRNIEPHKGMYDLPGGFVDMHESYEQAAIREGREELGIAVSLKQIIHSDSDNYLYSGRYTLVLPVFYLCEPILEQDVLADKNELSGFAFFDAQEVTVKEDLLCWECDKRAIKTYFKSIS